MSKFTTSWVQMGNCTEFPTITPTYEPGRISSPRPSSGVHRPGQISTAGLPLTRTAGRRPRPQTLSWFLGYWLRNLALFYLKSVSFFVYVIIIVFFFIIFIISLIVFISFYFIIISLHTVLLVLLIFLSILLCYFIFTVFISFYFIIISLPIVLLVLLIFLSSLFYYFIFFDCLYFPLLTVVPSNCL